MQNTDERSFPEVAEVVGTLMNNISGWINIDGERFQREINRFLSNYEELLHGTVIPSGYVAAAGTKTQL